MVGLRKGHSYSRVKRAYTRKSKYKKKGYIKAIPTSKVIRYTMGDQTLSYSHRVDLVSKQPIQVRHNALESCRQVINRKLTIAIGVNRYLFLVRPYPHHVLRENKMITGAGADRVQTGMQRAFGRPVGIACQLREGQLVYSVYCQEADVLKAKEALNMARHRMPGQYSFVIGRVLEPLAVASQ